MHRTVYGLSSSAVFVRIGVDVYRVELLDVEEEETTLYYLRILLLATVSRLRVHRLLLRLRRGLESDCSSGAARARPLIFARRPRSPCCLLAASQLEFSGRASDLYGKGGDFLAHKV